MMVHSDKYYYQDDYTDSEWQYSLINVTIRDYPMTISAGIQNTNACSVTSSVTSRGEYGG